MQAAARPTGLTLRNRLTLVAAGVAVIAIVAFAGYRFGGGGVAAGLPAASPAASSSIDLAAVSDYMQKIAANPKDTTSLQGLADLYYGGGDYTSAAQFLNQILAYDPTNERALLGLGAADFNNGDSTGAETAWKQVVSLNAKSVEAHYDLGFLYLNLNDLAGVQREWQLVIQLDPGSDVAKNVQDHLTRSRPRHRRAPRLTRAAHRQPRRRPPPPRPIRQVRRQPQLRAEAPSHDRPERRGAPDRLRWRRHLVRLAVLPADDPGLRELHGRDERRGPLRRSTRSPARPHPRAVVRPRVLPRLRRLLGLDRRGRVRPGRQRQDPAADRRRPPDLRRPPDRGRDQRSAPLERHAGAAGHDRHQRRRGPPRPASVLRPFGRLRGAVRRRLEPLHRADPRRDHRPRLGQRERRRGHGPARRLRRRPRRPVHGRRARGRRGRPAARLGRPPQPRRVHS